MNRGPASVRGLRRVIELGARSVLGNDLHLLKAAAGSRRPKPGCVWGGRLTAWIAEEDRLVSLPARAAHQSG